MRALVLRLKFFLLGLCLDFCLAVGLNQECKAGAWAGGLEHEYKLIYVWGGGVWVRDMRKYHRTV